MPEFAYKARNAEGGLVEGVLNCPDRGIAIRQIEQQNCIPIRIDAVTTATPVAPGPTPPRNFVPKIFNRGPAERADVPAQNLRVPHSQLLVFTEQLAHLQQAGMTLDEGLGVLEKRLKHPRVQQMIRALHQAFVRSDEGRTAWDRFRLRIPGYGRIVRHSYYAQFSRTLGTLIENGIPLLRSLDLVAEIAGNRYVEKKLTEVRRAIVDGAHLSAALAGQQLFPDLLTDMMAVGEQTGHFGQTMMTIADVYERELDRTVTITSSLIAPVIIVIIAIIVGFVVYSILSAVFSMTQSLQFRAR